MPRARRPMFPQTTASKKIKTRHKQNLKIIPKTYSKRFTVENRLGDVETLAATSASEEMPAL